MPRPCPSMSASDRMCLQTSSPFPPGWTRWSPSASCRRPLVPSHRRSSDRRWEGGPCSVEEDAGDRGDGIVGTRRGRDRHRADGEGEQRLGQPPGRDVVANLARPLAVDQQSAHRRHDGALELVDALRGRCRDATTIASPAARIARTERATPSRTGTPSMRAERSPAPAPATATATTSSTRDCRLEVAVDRRARHAGLGRHVPDAGGVGPGGEARAAAATITPATRLCSASGGWLGGMRR